VNVNVVVLCSSKAILDVTVSVVERNGFGKDVRSGSPVTISSSVPVSMSMVFFGDVDFLLWLFVVFLHLLILLNLVLFPSCFG